MIKQIQRKSKTMKKSIVIVISIIIIIGLAAGGVFFYTIATPEYALAKIIKDTRSSGINGLKKHLTENAIEQVEMVENWTNNASVSEMLAAITPNSAASFLKSKISEVDWTVKDVLKGKNQTNVVIQFDYRDSIVGTIEVVMIKDKTKWKIDTLKFYHLDRFLLW